MFRPSAGSEMKPLTLDRTYDNVLLCQGYRTPHAAVTDGYGAMVKLCWLGKTKIQELNLSQCHFFHHKSHTNFWAEHCRQMVRTPVCHHRWSSVIVLAIRPNVREFKPVRGRWAINVCSATSFGGEIKPSVPCRQILRHVKDPCSMKDTCRQNSLAFLAKVLLIRYRISLLVTARGLWWRNQKWLKLRWGSTTDQ
jgi:hypothetical protein